MSKISSSRPTVAKFGQLRELRCHAITSFAMLVISSMVEVFFRGPFLFSLHFLRLLKVFVSWTFLLELVSVIERAPQC